jgi:hypothetical protein
VRRTLKVQHRCGRRGRSDTDTAAEIGQNNIPVAIGDSRASINYYVASGATSDIIYIWPAGSTGQIN